MNNKRTIGIYLTAAISLITFVVYLSDLHHEFVAWDDYSYVENNLAIRSFNLSFILWTFSTLALGNWHPLTWISLAIDHALWGLNPLGYHLTNNLLHACNTAVVVFLIMRLLNFVHDTTKERSEFLSERTILLTGGMTGLLFGLHPLHVESVAWISERKDLLCALFYLLSINSYAKYASANRDRTDLIPLFSRFTQRPYLLTFTFAVLAILSKPMAVSLPIILLILDWYPFNRIQSTSTFRTALIEKIPLFALSVLSSVLTYLAQKAGGAISDVPLSIRILVAVRSFIIYLGKMLIPLHLNPLYPFPTSRTISLVSLDSFLFAATLITMTAVCIFLAKKQKVWLATWGYYIITLIPVIGIVHVGKQAMADRYTYLPSLGPFLMIALGFAWITRRKAASKTGLQVLKTMAVTMFVFICIAMSYLTIKQIRVWKTSITLWNEVIDNNPTEIPLAYHFRGVAYKRMGQYDKAIDDFDRSILLDRTNPGVFINRGATFEEMRQFDRAIEDYDTALAIRPSYEGYLKRGLLFDKLGMTDKALESYNQAIALDPSFPGAYLSAGRLYRQAGLYDKAIEHYSKYITIDADNADAYNDRGLCYIFLNRYDEALNDLNIAIHLDKGLALAYRNRANIFMEKKLKDFAHENYKKACELGDAYACTRL